ncbi:MAG: LacI family DNA-binding transcriptional regulator [Lachnospiraceae bacterium]|jgi:ribose transport system substrate-binding protein|nr:LacI family DNA-binding transcriptional regulator [Lachnospiraceae bacterium]
MRTKKVNIKDVAEVAGVSIASVSHVINKTRYVSPDLVKKVEDAMATTGYLANNAKREEKLRVGKNSSIVAIFPNLATGLYSDIAMKLGTIVKERGFQFFVGISENNPEMEHQMLHHLISQRDVAGIAFVPTQSDSGQYKELIQSRIPFVCMERSIRGADVNSVQFKDREAIFRGTSYLIECGHTNMMYIREDIEGSSREERTDGFLTALMNAHMNVETANILDVSLINEHEESVSRIQSALAKTMPTAVVASGNRITLFLMRALRNVGMRYPDDVSIIGFGDEKWTQIIDRPLTTLRRDTAEFSRYVAEILFQHIETAQAINRCEYADILLQFKKSTRMLDNGPYGEKAASMEEIVLTEQERRELRAKKHRVIIAFHYMGTAWAELHEKGIRDELEKYGIDVISSMDAHFDPDLQIAQLRSIRLQEPDAVIAVPTDDRKTAEAFSKLAEVTKLVFLGSIPENIPRNSYVSFVSVNEAENGSNVARLMGEYYQDRTEAKIGLINHGATFYGTRARDQAVERTLLEKYHNIRIVAVRNFSQIDNAYQVCQDMIEAHPEIEGIYVSWDRPALQAIKALRVLKREDIAVFTTDLDREIAVKMSEGVVRGMSSQRPYEQGRAAALVVAKSLVSSDVPKYVGVQPYIVTPDELQKSWIDIFHEEIPFKSNNLRK